MRNTIILSLITVCLFTCSKPKDLDYKKNLQAFVDKQISLPGAASFYSAFSDIVTAHRQIIVLFVDETNISPEDLAVVARAGKEIFYEKEAVSDLLNDSLKAVAANKDVKRFILIDELLTYIESDTSLYDADRLALKENLKILHSAVAADQTLPALKVHRRISEDLDALNEIENMYNKELRQIFNRFADRSIEISRQRWEDYVEKIQDMHSRDEILRDRGVILPAYQPETAADFEVIRISGHELPDKTIVLTFDDGPHHTYTEEIAAVLNQYGIYGIFFQVGRNIAVIDVEGRINLNKGADISKKLIKSGHVLANHSYSHINFKKSTYAEAAAEISRAERILGKVGAGRSTIFRFPYGAYTAESIELLKEHNMHSVIWNVDSLDWADPIPNSIAKRVLQNVEKQGKGIILFHDINDRSVKALPVILDRLVAEGYRFARWDGHDFTAGSQIIAVDRTSPSSGYQDSWALIVGIDQYHKWPPLEYAVRDAESVEAALVSNFGFDSSRIIILKNGQATRKNILKAMNQQLGAGKVKADDRVFIFFAGHGATRKLSSGRDLGYIIPVESDPMDFATDAIAMTELKNSSESLPAKHVFFVMDSCYSGLGLVRGISPMNYLNENSRRIGRQMLTAGGADQMVSDGGPNNHSIFTWTLLQGLEGKADLNNDGFITASELSVYVAPAVASMSQQTPAFGSLPGSEGGEFIFELQADNEFLSTDSTEVSAEELAFNQQLSSNLNKIKKTRSSDLSSNVIEVKKALASVESKIKKTKTATLPPKQAAQRIHDQGLMLFREKKYSEAAAKFAQALRLRPNYALAANNLGYAYFVQGKIKQSIVWYEKSLEMDPSRAIAYYNLGEAYIEINQNEKARKAIETYLELAPNTKNRAEAQRILKGL